MKSTTSFILTIVLCGILIFWTTISVRAQTPASEFLQLKKDFYRGQIKEAQLINKLNKQLKSVKKISNQAERYYWQARINLLLAGIVGRQNNQQQRVVDYLQTSKQLANQSLELNNKLSDSYRVLADSHAQLIDYQGPLYAVQNGRKILKLLKKAVKLDAANYTAYNSLGIAYLKAPKFGGGSIDKAIKYLKQALSSSNQVENFISYLWLAKSYRQSGKKEQAVNYLDQALAIYPDNPTGKQLLQDLES